MPLGLNEGPLVKPKRAPGGNTEKIGRIIDIIDISCDLSERTASDHNHIRQMTLSRLKGV
jgi:hypothetical protein